MRDSLGMDAQDYRVMAAAFKQFGDRIPEGYNSRGFDGIVGCPAVRVAQARILSTANWSKKMLLRLFPLGPYGCGAPGVFGAVLHVRYFDNGPPSATCLRRAAAIEATEAARKIAALQEFTAPEFTHSETETGAGVEIRGNG